MEIELKYKIPTEAVAADIWKDKIFSDMEEEDSREEVCLDARYYDTCHCDLSKKQIAYRIRKEGERWVAALKCSGTNEGALHKRIEISVPVIDGTPDPSVFSESEMGEELMEVLGDEKVECVLETRFHRKRFRIDTGTGIFELSVDKGVILTNYGKEPIFEVELELFSGEMEELVELGEQLQEKYGLEVQELSKYARGIELIKKGKREAKEAAAAGREQAAQYHSER